MLRVNMLSIDCLFIGCRCEGGTNSKLAPMQTFANASGTAYEHSATTERGRRRSLPTGQAYSARTSVRLSGASKISAWSTSSGSPPPWVSRWLTCSLRRNFEVSATNEIPRVARPAQNGEYGESRWLPPHLACGRPLPEGRGEESTASMRCQARRNARRPSIAFG
jgi:hypothetical protein